MRHSKNFLTVIFLVLATVAWSQSTKSDTTRILFIGNSYTYYNSLPELVKALAQEKFPDHVIETELVSQGGMTLKRHWEEGRAQKTIKSAEWDYVVLQEQSKLGMAVMIDNEIYFGQTDRFFEYARKLDAEIKKAGAETVFFMPWSVKNRPEEQELVTYAYSTIAKELQAILAPVGLVWQELRTNDQFDFYNRDGSHPSPTGSYLAATTIFSTLFQESPLGLSGSISGKELSSSGRPSLESVLLTDIAPGESKAIQGTSWSVVEKMQKSGDYPKVLKPEPTYTMPVLAEGETIDKTNIAGRWYGTSTYGFNYLGHILDVDFMDGDLIVDLSFYSPDKKDKITIQKAQIIKNQLVLVGYDSLRNISPTIRFALNEDQLTGILESFGNITVYKHLNLSRKSSQEGVDMAAFDQLMETFQAEIVKEGYAKAAVNHYQRYSELIGKAYLPEEAYLNAMGYNLLRDDKINDALEQFELAMTLYPMSVNTYDSYGEALEKAGDIEKAVEIYSAGYELAKKTNDENLSYIEGKLKKLKAGGQNNQPLNVPSPPPPPPRH